MSDAGSHTGRPESGTVAAIELSRLGDAIVTVRPLFLFSRSFPEASLHIVVRKNYSTFFSRLFPAATVHGVEETRRLPALLSAGLRLRRESPDLALSWSPSLSNGLMARFSGAKSKVGYLGLQGSLTPFLNRYQAVSMPSRGLAPVEYHRENIEERPRKVLQVLGLLKGGETKSEVHSTISWPTPSAARQTSGRIVVHPFAGWKYREWPLERFHEIIREILAHSRYTVQVLSTNETLEHVSALFRPDMAGGRLECVAPPDLAALADVVQGAALFIGNDSGPLHLASLLGVPCVGLFGPASPVFTAPLRPGGTFLFHALPCSPCGQEHCVRPDRTCMDEISVPEVSSALASRLGERTSRTTAA